MDKESYISSINELENDLSDEIVEFVFNEHNITSLDDADYSTLNEIFNELDAYSNSD